MQMRAMQNFWSRGFFQPGTSPIFLSHSHGKRKLWIWISINYNGCLTRVLPAWSTIQEVVSMSMKPAYLIYHITLRWPWIMENVACWHAETWDLIAPTCKVKYMPGRRTAASVLETEFYQGIYSARNYSHLPISPVSLPWPPLVLYQRWKQEPACIHNHWLILNPSASSLYDRKHRKALGVCHFPCWIEPYRVTAYLQIANWWPLVATLFENHS